MKQKERSSPISSPVSRRLRQASTLAVSKCRFGRMLETSARSSAGQSIGLLSRGSQVRILAGALETKDLPCTS